MNNKHCQACCNLRRHFSRFVLSVDGVMGKKALFILATLSQLMSARLDKSISHFTGCFNSRIIIAVARLYSRVLCVDISHKSIEDPGTRVGIGIRIGFGVVIISCQTCILHTHTHTHPSESIHTSRLLTHPPLTDRKDNVQG